MCEVSFIPALILVLVLGVFGLLVVQLFPPPVATPRLVLMHADAAGFCDFLRPRFKCFVGHMLDNI